MKQYKLVNNLLGWITFAIAAFTYCMTVEPTASFWDCPEFITTAYKLEVGHPPGAPFFMLTGNFFTQFTDDPSKVAFCVNIMSALLSALCILFLFWTITHLARMLLIEDGKVTTWAQTVLIMGCGLTGALAYTWSDTFWFSAVEGEVYAYSSMFTALVFWLILKWEEHADEPHSDRWLVLIFYLTGLSIGVHLLNLLCLPAIALVYYYKRKPDANLKGSLVALTISMLLVAAVLYGVVPGIVKVGGWFEWFFVNDLGMPFNTGVIIYIIALIAVVLAAIWSTTTPGRKRTTLLYGLSVALLGIPFMGHGALSIVLGLVVLGVLGFVLQRKDKNGNYVLRKRFLNTSLLCMLMLMIGYSSYAVIVIRSTQNTPMDQNSPEDIFTLGSYMSREQYGSYPLFKGEAYCSQSQAYAAGAIDYKRNMRTQRREKADANEPDSYEEIEETTGVKYPAGLTMLFPRMWSAAHTGQYEQWMGSIDTKSVIFSTPDGYDMMGEMPTQFENLRFFLSYQINFMYWRYFMWNFAGRQNDLQGNGELEHGNWITGFDWFDNWRLGDQSKLPDELKNNKGHNVFYCLPLLLGLIGLFWQSLGKGQKGIRQFWVVLFLFFMTGLAIVLYLNQTPMQPRERDYAYAGSFYAFAIWCGMGVAAIIEALTRRLKGHETVVASIIGIACLLVPIQMASQTWDDHDRSGRYTCRDFGRNYLMSLEEKGNPIIFTNGDNDTFPLWYNQDVEGERTDARVCNLSYLQTDWYIDQMKRPAYDSPALPINWSRLEYCAGTNEYVTVEPALKESVKTLYDTYPEEAAKMFGDNPYELKNVLKYWVRNDVSKEQKEVMKLLLGDTDTHVIPTDTVYVTIEKEAVKKSGMLMAADSIPDRMVISLKGKRALYKGDLMMLELIANCNWTRPIYVALTVGEDNYMNLGDNFVQEGLVNRITPFTTNAPGAKNFDSKRTYDRMMNKFRFGGLDTPGIYLDETVMRMCWTHRRAFVNLAMNLVNEGEDKKAANVLAYLDKNIPEYNVPLNYQSGSLDEARVYAHLGQKQKAMDMFKKLFNNSYQYAAWYCGLEDFRFVSAQRDALLHFYIMNQILVEANDINEKWAKTQQVRMNGLLQLYRSKGGSFGDEEE